MTPQLPERPNSEQLKRQAKDLLRAARALDARALARMRGLPAFAHLDDDAKLAATIALHDAQSVIARELGFPSWKAMVERVHELSMDDFHKALILGDAPRVEAQLAARPGAATARGGPRDWEPLLYVCHTSLDFGPATRSEGLVAVARVLLTHGADPNTRFPWKHHGVHRAVLWGAVCATRLLPLAEVLLDAGADANDGVTLPLSAAAGDIAALELLRAHGADVNQAWATDGSATLHAILSWTTTSAGVHWLLDHGADPDPVFAPTGETPLHVAARRSSVAVVEALVRRGANVARRRTDGRTPYALAELSGNTAVAEWLAQHGGASELADVDRMVAACARGDRETASSIVRARPSVQTEIQREHYAALYAAAERGDSGALDAMLGCGFDPDHADDEIGKTALHVAAMQGHAGAVRTLLEHGASVAVRDREFHGQPLVWAAEGSLSHTSNGRDYNAVGRLLLDAGSSTEWEPGKEPSEELLDVLATWKRSMSHN